MVQPHSGEPQEAFTATAPNLPPCPTDDPNRYVYIGDPDYSAATDPCIATFPSGVRGIMLWNQRTDYPMTVVLDEVIGGGLWTFRQAPLKLGPGEKYTLGCRMITFAGGNYSNEYRVVSVAWG